MSGRRGTVTKTERVPEGVEVTVDFGGDDLASVEHYAPPGFDLLPRIGDEVLVEEADGAGAGTAVAYQDLKNVGTAAEGELRFYSRDADGAVAVEFWAKANGDLSITSIKTGGKVTINGVEIDQQGNITTPGEVTAKAETPATAVSLSTHLHPTGVGPTSPPTPGT